MNTVLVLFFPLGVRRVRSFLFCFQIKVCVLSSHSMGRFPTLNRVPFGRLLSIDHHELKDEDASPVLPHCVKLRHVCRRWLEVPRFDDSGGSEESMAGGS